MKFGTVKEYFYKLNNTGYQLMMIPLIIFIIYYSQPIIDLSELVILNQEVSRILVIFFSGLSLLVLITVQIVTRQRANKIATEVGLGIKLEKLGDVLKKKMGVLSTTILFMPLMLLITNESYFSVAFGILSLWYFVQWPTTGRVCRLLKLRGDEREMVITKGDAFQ